MSSGTLAARPAAATFGKGFYYVTDMQRLDHSNGAAWVVCGMPRYGSMRNGTPQTGDYIDPDGATLNTSSPALNQLKVSVLTLGNDVTFDRIGLEVTGAGTAARSVTDAVLNSTTTITSATASFVAGDVGKVLSGNANIPAGTYIASVTNSTTAVMSAAATASVSGQSVTLSASMVRLVVYADNGNGFPGALQFDAGTIDGSSATYQEITINQTLPAGIWWVGGAAQGGQPTIRTVAGMIMPTHFRAGTDTNLGGFTHSAIPNAAPANFTATAVTGSSAPRVMLRVV